MLELSLESLYKSWGFNWAFIIMLSQYDCDEPWSSRYDPPTSRQYLSSNRHFHAGLRHDMELLRKCSSLKELNVYLIQGPRYDPRGISTQVAWLKKRNVKVTVRIGSDELEMKPEADKIGQELAGYFIVVRRS